MSETVLFENSSESYLLNACMDPRAIKCKELPINLGVLMDFDLSIRSHVKAITKSAFFHLKRKSQQNKIFSD